MSSDDDCYLWRQRHRERFNEYETANRAFNEAQREEDQVQSEYGASVTYRETMKSGVSAAERDYHLAKDDYDRASGMAETVVDGAALAAAKAALAYAEQRLSSAEGEVSAMVRQLGEAGARTSAREREANAALAAVDEAVAMINRHCG